MKLPLENQGDRVDRKGDVSFKKHSILFLNIIRALADLATVEEVLLSLLLEPNGIRFENIYMWSKFLFQNKYEFFKNFTKVDGVQYISLEQNEDILDPSQGRKNSIFIFNDVACDK